MGKHSHTSIIQDDVYVNFKQNITLDGTLLQIKIHWKM